MLYWVLRSCQRISVIVTRYSILLLRPYNTLGYMFSDNANSELISRTYCAMTVREKALHPFIGYITSVRPVDPTIPK